MGRLRDGGGGALAAGLKRLLLPAAILLAGYWAVWGGEYSLFELRRARLATEAEAAELARIRAEIDSLGLLTDSLENDPALLERLARERYGMIKDGEILYRFAEPADSAPADSVGGGAEPAGGDTVR